ncbi:MAG TPA: hypothetical protein VIM12_03130 [Noviherbaspirillum sp.]|uniref:hypothetical protein n=1 Tax=Noviherbaspirillum sp. TaxID=1926288 RepID=UPI002F925533
MSIATTGVGGFRVGFTGTSCADFARAITIYRWEHNGYVDGWTQVSCLADLLPQSGRFDFKWWNSETQQETSDYGYIEQMDSYRTYRESAGAFESLFQLTVPEAVALSWAVALVWVVAWAIKQAIRALGSSKDAEEN